MVLGNAARLLFTRRDGAADLRAANGPAVPWTLRLGDVMLRPGPIEAEKC